MSSRNASTSRAALRVLLLGQIVAVACSGNPDRQTLAGLRAVPPDLREVTVENGLDQAMEGYRQFLEEAPTSTLTPEAMRRLADLKLEKEYGLTEALPRAAASARTGTPPDGPAAAPTPALPLAPPAQRVPAVPSAPPPDRATLPIAAANAVEPAASGESLGDFEARATDTRAPDAAGDRPALVLPGGRDAAPTGPLEALALYDRILTTYPDYAHNDQVLYQKARALDELGRVDEAIEVSALLVARYPGSRHLDEIQFRRGEYFFTRKKWIEAEGAYAAIASMGARSDYYELALYKLGWTFYKQLLLPEALDAYVKLLDHKVANEYDFDQTADEASAQRIADSHRVMSLCFSDLGGAEAVTSYFVSSGPRVYENRVYRNLAEFYFEKLRYQDAADTYEAFVARYPLHADAPHYGMRIVEIYQAGDFPKLVLEAKKDFASRYALDSDYWHHFEPGASPEVIAYLKRNLEDLANHYHALYQDTEAPEERTAAFAESAAWYRRYLASFPDAPETPGIHYRLADLLLENESFAAAAKEYEHIAYVYPAHERSAAAGYAAIFAHRKAEEQAPESEREPIRREAVASTIRFVDRFPDHEHAAKVLGVAVRDLFEMKSHAQAIELGTRLTSSYPTADPEIRESAWLVVGHASFEIADFASAERAYGEVLALMPSDDESRDAVVNNLAASIYKQGERANEAGDYRAAADHFLRVAKSAPGSDIRPIAEYDAGTALLRLEDWSGALAVLEAFRESHPDHSLHQEATQQIAFVHRKTGHAARAAEEYERVAREADTAELRAESLLVAGELYQEATLPERALAAYRRYVSEFTEPIETAVVTRFKMAELYATTGDRDARHEELRRIVSLDRSAGDARTDAMRGVAARSALLLCEDQYSDFAAVALRQPFERSLQDKQRRMNGLLGDLGSLLDYQVGEITAAATYYMAEVYADFSRSLLDSERPSDLSTAERDEYEGMLEEEAFPFEEKSIRVHEKNLELMASGIYNPWIGKSLGRLADLMPGRYAKPEESTGPLASLEVYSYRAPAAQPTANVDTDADADAQAAERAVEATAETIDSAGIAEPPELSALTQATRSTDPTGAVLPTRTTTPAEGAIEQSTPSAETVEPAAPDPAPAPPASMQEVSDEPGN
ncbi:MAG: tetratricopeptide repeat protein [Myxococcota bacterium]